MKTFRSIEFRDEEGDLVIGHRFMDDVEAEEFMQRLINSGATEATICDLTPDESASVNSTDDNRLENSSRRLLR